MQNTGTSQHEWWALPEVWKMKEGQRNIIRQYLTLEAGEGRKDWTVRGLTLTFPSTFWASVIKISPQELGYFFFIIKLIGVTLINKTIYISNVQFYDTSSVYCIVFPPPKVKFPPITIHSTPSYWSNQKMIALFTFHRMTVLWKLSWVLYNHLQEVIIKKKNVVIYKWLTLGREGLHGVQSRSHFWTQIQGLGKQNSLQSQNKMCRYWKGWRFGGITTLYHSDFLQDQTKSASWLVSFNLWPMFKESSKEWVNCFAFGKFPKQACESYWRVLSATVNSKISSNWLFKTFYYKILVFNHSVSETWLISVGWRALNAQVNLPTMLRTYQAFWVKKPVATTLCLSRFLAIGFNISMFLKTVKISFTSTTSCALFWT